MKTLTEIFIPKHLASDISVFISLRKVMCWEPEIDCNTEIAKLQYWMDCEAYSFYRRNEGKYKIT